MQTCNGDWAGAASGNLLLGRLRASDRELLLPHLAEVELAEGTRLLHAASRIDHAYFPEAGTIALEEEIGGHHVEVAVVGREGMLGWPVLLGCERGVHDAVVRGGGGRAVSMPLAPLLAACRDSASLWTTLLSFVQSLMVQMARTIASHVESTLEQKVARWVLMRHDRVGGDQMLIRHDQIADALNARRASVTDRLHVLEGEQLIRCRRGRIIVRDRGALERLAGDAYGGAEAGYRELIAPFGKSAG